MKTDIEISNGAKVQNICEIAQKLKISEEAIIPYGKYMAKIDTSKVKANKKGKLILVTSTNPTPFGEGKTTLSIGLHDALCHLGENSLVVLREPSLGPVFGIKGGATGGGYSQVVPMENINLHFTGDMHAITACNNLMCAALDNYIFQGNEIGIDPGTILVPRAMDMNDRALRKISLENRNDSFVITVASEIMAILCLSSDLMDLKKRLGNILLGYTYDKKAVFVKTLGFEDAMTILLKDAIKPNLVQTLECNPAIIHGGPFANIAHGCNSVIATKLGLSLADYVITEAGFGADLGAEKFLDIKCRLAGLHPDCIVINSTIRSIKYNGGCSKENLEKESIEYLEKGINNLSVHIENMLKYSKNVMVCLNRFNSDTDKEIEFVKEYVNNKGVEFSVSTAYFDGGKGATDAAKKIIEICKNDSEFKCLYSDDLTIEDKIEKIAKEIYRADAVKYNEDVKEKIDMIRSLGFEKLPVCIAKTQYSLSDDAKKIGVVGGYDVTVRDIKVSSGAGFIVVLMGSIMTMPGLSKVPALTKMHIDENGIIEGLF